MFSTTFRVRLARLAPLALLLALLTACGGGAAGSPTATPREQPTKVAKEEPTAAPKEEPTAVPEEPTPAATGEVEVVNATFAKQLGENQEPIDPTQEFYPDETIYFSLEFAGRPQEGVVRSEFFWGEESIAAAEVNFADANSGVLFSVGQSTFAGFNLTHENPLPISGNYRVETTLDGDPLGTWGFAVIPPADAIESRVNEATLAKDRDDSYAPIDPTTEFTTDETVYLVGRGDFGTLAWLKVEWIVNGALDEAGKQTLGPMEENVEDTGFSFHYRPEGGWAEGEHEVVLYVNDEEVERYAFTVGALAAVPTSTSEETTSSAAVEFGELVQFSPESGLFTIEVPQDWEFSDNSNELSANYSWSAPTGTAGIIISLYENSEAQTEEQLTESGTDFVTTVFGDAAEFEIIETTPQSDGSVLVAWTASPEINGGPVKLVGLSYIEQRENKISLLNVLMPADQYDALWEAGFRQIVNSYKIDPSVSITG